MPNDFPFMSNLFPYTNYEAVNMDWLCNVYKELQEKIANGELDGPQGPEGPQGPVGPSGDGLTEDVKQALLQLASKVAYIDGNGAQYYQDLYDALYNVNPPITLVSIAAAYTQSGTVYDTDTLSSLKADLVVTATYSDSSTAVIPSTDYALSGTLTAGTSTILVAYGDAVTTFTVTVTQNTVTLVSISAVYTQSGPVYDTDTVDSLIPDLVVTATYSDSSTAVISSDDYTLSGSLTAGTSTITVTYSGETATFNVTVTAFVLVSIAAVYTQSGTVYNTDTLSSLKADLVVTATYSDSTTAVVPPTDYTLSGVLASGTSTITVSYSGQTTTFNVTVTEYLPTGYTKYDYITNTTRGNVNSRIETDVDYTYGGANYEHILEFAITGGTTTAGGVFGLRAATGQVANSLCLWANYTDGNGIGSVDAADMATGYTLYVSAVKSVLKITHDSGNTKVYFDNALVTDAPDVSYTVDASKRFCLCGLRTASNANSGSTNTTNKIYKYSIKNLTTDALEFEYVPCTNPSNVAGLYDRVNGTFITASGGSSHIAAGND